MRAASLGFCTEARRLDPSSPVIWGSVPPEDRSRLVDDEVRLVQAGVHSRRTAANELGVEDPDEEYRLCQEEQQTTPRPHSLDRG